MSFGTTGRCAPFDDELVQRLESHSFDPLTLLQWRNSELDFSSVGALQASLSEIPTEPGLTRAPLAEDILVLDHAARDEWNWRPHYQLETMITDMLQHLSRKLGRPLHAPVRLSS